MEQSKTTSVLADFRGSDYLLDLLSTESNSPRILLVSGLPGSGKSTFVKLLSQSGLTDTTFIGLDRFGSIIDGKWIVDLPQLNEAINIEIAAGMTNIILEGTSDNISELSPRISAFVFLVPEFDTLRQVYARRSITVKDPGFAEGFEDMSHLTNRSITLRLMDMVAKFKIQSETIFILPPAFKLSPDAYGWA